MVRIVPLALVARGGMYSKSIVADIYTKSIVAEDLELIFPL